MGIDGNGALLVIADRLAPGLDEADWVRCSAVNGAKESRVYDWAVVAIRPLRKPRKAHWCWSGQHRQTGELAQYVCYGPAGTALEEPVRVVETRWTIEKRFEDAQGQRLLPPRKGWGWTNM